MGENGVYFPHNGIISTIMDYSPHLYKSTYRKHLMLREFQLKCKVVYFSVGAHVIYL